MYASTAHELPEGNAWLYEVKFDGYRCLAGRNSTGVTLWSRRGNIFTDQFPQIAKACEQLPPDTMIDGEVVAIDKNGRISFNLLQHHRSQAQALVFYAFDVLVHRGRSLFRLPVSLEQRRDVLNDIFRSIGPGPLALSENIHAEPEELKRVVREFGFEGIVAKRIDSLYEPGRRSGAWLKYKLHHSEEFLIGGYTSGYPFTSLLVGYYHEGKLYYAGKIKDGFVPHTRCEVANRFAGLETDVCPFVNLPEKNRTKWAITREAMKVCRWLRPELVAQVGYVEWTVEGQLRHPKFLDLRDDKNPSEVVRE
jgi:bifunctional non-homologous end joining protein LigD